MQVSGSQAQEDTQPQQISQSQAQKEPGAAEGESKGVYWQGVCEEGQQRSAKGGETDLRSGQGLCLWEEDPSREGKAGR